MIEITKPKPSQEVLDSLVGCMYDEAKDMLDYYFGYTLRPVSINGRPCVCTRDYRLDRINVEIECNVITKVRGVG